MIVDNYLKRKYEDGGKTPKPEEKGLSKESLDLIDTTYKSSIMRKSMKFVHDSMGVSSATNMMLAIPTLAISMIIESPSYSPEEQRLAEEYADSFFGNRIDETVNKYGEQAIKAKPIILKEYGYPPNTKSIDIIKEFTNSPDEYIHNIYNKKTSSSVKEYHDNTPIIPKTLDNTIHYTEVGINKGEEYFNKLKEYLNK